MKITTELKIEKVRERKKPEKKPLLEMTLSKPEQRSERYHLRLDQDTFCPSGIPSGKNLKGQTLKLVLEFSDMILVKKEEEENLLKVNFLEERRRTIPTNGGLIHPQTVSRVMRLEQPSPDDCQQKKQARKFLVLPITAEVYETLQAELSEETHCKLCLSVEK